MYCSFINTFLLFTLTYCIACQENDTVVSTQNDTETIQPSDTLVLDTLAQASVISVTVSGQSGAYQFSVEIQSPDLGCDQYADWWEVITKEQELVYRRILTHSHVNEQPFTRSGGPVNLDEGDEVWVRAHMNNTGYGQVVMEGSVLEGFTKDTLSIGFADSLSLVAPLPQGCAF